MQSSTTHSHAQLHRRDRTAFRRIAPSLLLALAVILLAIVALTLDAAAQGRVITQFPYAQSFAFIPSGTSTTPNGPIGAAVFPTTDVDGGELIVDSTTSPLMVNGSSTGLNNVLGAGGAIRIQTSGSALPSIAQGFIVHASFTNRLAGSISIDWTKVTNGTSTRSNELRIAASADGGAFSPITSVTFDNSSTAQSGTLTATLPSTLDGVDSVRFRIYSINVGGSGTHPRVIVDDLAIVAEEERPLPVELASFTASYVDGTVALRWRTASEHDNEGFEVERALASDSAFSVIASYRSSDELRGLGTSPGGRSYDFVDDLPPSLEVDGVELLYRVTDVSTDGTRTSHALRTVRIARAISLPAAPSVVRLRLDRPRLSPEGDRLLFDLTLANREEVALELLTTDGRRISSDRVELAEGRHARSMSIAGLPSGSYMIIARVAGAMRSQSVVIAR